LLLTPVQSSIAIPPSRRSPSVGGPADENVLSGCVREAGLACADGAGVAGGRNRSSFKRGGQAPSPRGPSGTHRHWLRRDLSERPVGHPRREKIDRPGPGGGEPPAAGPVPAPPRRRRPCVAQISRRGMVPHLLGVHLPPPGGVPNKPPILVRPKRICRVRCLTSAQQRRQQLGRSCR